MFRKKIKFDPDSLSYTITNVDGDSSSDDHDYPHKEPPLYLNDVSIGESDVTSTHELSISDQHTPTYSEIQDALADVTFTTDEFNPASSPRVHQFSFSSDNVNINVEGNNESTSTKVEDINWHDNDECLQQCTDYLADKSEMSKLCAKLLSEGLLKDFISLVSMLISGQMPVNNLAFVACMERTRFESVETTTQMRYSDLTKRFWATVLQIGRGRVMQLLAGRKSGGNVVNNVEEQGHFHPNKASINFAIPCREVLDKALGQISKCLEPGIITDTFDMLDKTCQHVLMFDAKKIAAGLGEYPLGDVNLMGVEGPPSLLERKQNFDSHIDLFDQLKALLDEDEASGGDDRKIDTVPLIKAIVCAFGSILKDVKDTVAKCERQISKLSSYVDVKKPHRYDLAIGNEKGRVHLANEFQTGASYLLGELTFFLAFLNGCDKFTRDASPVEMATCGNYQSLHKVEVIMKSTRIPLNTQIIKQRSKLWHELRENSVITGSTAWSALGLRGKREQKKHFKEYVEKKTSGRLTSKVQQEKMQYGSDHEIDAVATCVSGFMPALLPPCYIFREVGSYFIDGTQRTDMLCVSPDGLLVCPAFEASSSDSSQHCDHHPIVVEIKCPFPQPGSTCLHFSIPNYYCIQLLLEMHVTRTKKCWYISYAKDFCTLIELAADEGLTNRALEAVSKLFDKEDPICSGPSVIDCENFKADVHTYLNESSKLKFIAPSKLAEDHICTCPTVSEPHHRNQNADVSHNQDIHIPLLGAHGSGLQLLKDAFQLLREKGQEILVGVITDTKRLYNPHIPTNMPVVYGLKSYSLPVHKMRQFVNITRQACHKEKIRILVEAYDGQWAPLVFRDCRNKPLTRFQLQKQCWQDVRNMGKEKLIDYFVSNSVVQSVDIDFWMDTAFTHKGKMTHGNLQVNYMPKTKTCPSKLIIGTPEHPDVERSVFEMLQGESSYMQRYYKHRGTNITAKRTFSEIQHIELNDIIQYIPSYIWSEDEDHDRVQSLSDLDTSRGSARSSMSLDDSLHISDSIGDNQPDLINRILFELRQTKFSNKYIMVSERDLYYDFLCSAQSLGKNMTVQELDTINRVIFEVVGKNVFLKSDKKPVKVNKLGALFGDEEKWMPKVKRRKTPPSLKAIVQSRINQKDFPRVILTCAKARVHYTISESEWDEKSTFPLYAEITGQTDVMSLFCYPEKNEERNQLEPRIIDPSHILNNVRSKICRSGIQDFSKTTVLKLASCNDKFIQSLMITQIIDQQSTEISLRFFSSYVEEKLRSIGEVSAANFVNLFRNWFFACDARGLDPLHRVDCLVAMHNYFLQDYDLSSFPPPGRYFKGIPVQTVEAILHNCSMRIILYELSDDNTYCHRAVSTAGEETFFSEISFMDYSGLNCPKANQVGYLMSHVVRLNHIRNDPERNFFMDGPKGARYNVDEKQRKLMECQQDEDPHFRFHIFDVPDNNNRKKRVKGSHRTNDVFGQEVGVGGVRLYYRRDTSKINALKKLGVEN